MKENKKQFGQFFTVNSDYVLGGFDRLVRGHEVCDPFAGNGDLLEWARRHGARSVVGYDVDERYTKGPVVRLRDSILEPGRYDFVVTNPPYLNVNKAKGQTKERYFQGRPFEDLYQISLSSLMDSEQGIIIVPINFLSAENADGIRDLFFGRFELTRVNYFREQVFPDTTNNVIAAHYRRRATSTIPAVMKVPTVIFPERLRIVVMLRRSHHWRIGGDFTADISEAEDTFGLWRLEEKHLKRYAGRLVPVRAALNHVGDVREVMMPEELARIARQSRFLLRAIDSGSESGQIGLDDIRDHGIDCLISRPTSRHMIHILTTVPIPVTKQKVIIRDFNRILRDARERYLSLFLTNYRDFDRKRISFDFAYALINRIISDRPSARTSLKRTSSRTPIAGSRFLNLR